MGLPLRVDQDRRSSARREVIRYAYPPNALGYCGPDDHAALFEYGTEGVVDGGSRALARDFDGAWPYLELIAHAAGKDPLDNEVVEAYWIGNRLLDRVDISAFGHSMEERFRGRAGMSWNAVSDAAAAGAKPSHSFHVFCVYPWVGLMRTASTKEPLRVLDQCRIRWGTVVELEGDVAVVESRPLVFDGDRLSLGPSHVERVVWAREGLGFARRLGPGDHVAMHWGWVCERLGPAAVRFLQKETVAAIGLTNGVLARPRTGILA
jgi:hypothetical protein